MYENTNVHVPFDANKPTLYTRALFALSLEHVLGILSYRSHKSDILDNTEYHSVHMSSSKLPKQSEMMCII